MDKKPKLAFVTEAAFEYPDATPRSPEDQGRVCGVTTTNYNIAPRLAPIYDVQFITPFDFPGEEQPFWPAVLRGNTPFAMPFYPSVRTVRPTGKYLRQRMDIIDPDHVHISTEGFLGMPAMLDCKKRGIPVTTALHTNWHQYVKEDGFRIPYVPRNIAAWVTLNAMLAFHKAADATMVATPELKNELVGLGLKAEKLHLVSRGVDSQIFKPYPESDAPVSGDYALYAGRIAPGKGVEQFCRLDTPGMKKIVVGKGPQELADKLKADFSTVSFVGFKEGEELARYYSGAKLFVLPSDTETFGITVIESLACGTPVVALNRGGHQPILNARPGLGVMRGDLQSAFNEAAGNPGQFMPPADMARYIHETRSWEQEAANFRAMIQAVRNHRALTQRI